MSTSVQSVSDAVQNKWGPGKLLGYWGTNQKLRIKQCKGTQVPGLSCSICFGPWRTGKQKFFKKKKKKKSNFTSEGPLWVVSLDGHDKLCEYRNSTFPLRVYGCLGTFSFKIMFLFVCYSDSDPKLIGKVYFKYLYEGKVLSRNLRIDKELKQGRWHI